MKQVNNKRKDGALKIRLEDFENLDARHELYYRVCKKIIKEDGACGEVSCMICPFFNSTRECIDYRSRDCCTAVDNVLVKSCKKFIKKLKEKYGEL